MKNPFLPTGYLLIILFVLILNSCKKDEVPVLTTSAVTNLTGTTATSGGTITSEGTGTVIGRGVCWSTGTTPTIADNKTVDGAGAGTFTSNIAELNGATIYYACAYATNSVGTGYGMTMTFTTLGQVPTTISVAPTNINSTSATLNGTVNANYLSTVVTFEYGTTTSYGNTATVTQSPITGNASTNISADISNLIAGIVYHFMIKTVNSLGTTYGNDMTFTTLGQVPALPPSATMLIDFSNFSAGKGLSENISFPKGIENTNWVFAVSPTVSWKLLISTTLNVPITAYKISVDQNPIYVSGKTWQWAYNVTVTGVAYKARLTSETSGSSVLWKMYITREGSGGFPEFLWFEGTSKVDGTEGQWVFNQSSQFPTPLLQIDWTKSGAGIVYTYLKNGDAFKTSYIEYGLTSNTLNAYYNVHYYNNVKFSDVNIEWNTTIHNGRVKCIDYLGDSLWHCWDANKNNVICP